MGVRIGRVTNIYPTEGKIKVAYEDERSVSLPLSMLTMNNEYSMPQVGDRVVTMHMENGSSKGFVLGTYYGGGTQPRANAGYRKDLGNDVYILCNGGVYQLNAKKISFSVNETVAVDITEEEISIKASDGIVIEADEVALKCSYGEITVEELMKRLERIEDQLGLPHEVE